MKLNTLLLTSYLITSLLSSVSHANTQLEVKHTTKVIDTQQTQYNDLREPSLDMSYRRALPLQDGSNFRDAGDYPTLDGTRVVRGELFRSAAMYAIDSPDDIDYLKRFNFATVLDLRTIEERELQPDRWVFEDDSITYKAHDYSFKAMLTELQSGKTFDMPTFYQGMHKALLPQLKIYFESLLQQQTPIVLHCSAGQDRTGFIAAMLLSALNVDRALILEDYQLSTDFRRPVIEKGDLNYAEAAKTNVFAQVMVAYSDKTPKTMYGSPLRTEDGKSFLSFAFEAIEAEYGSIANYLKAEVGVGEQEIATLKRLYTR